MITTIGETTTETDTAATAASTSPLSVARHSGRQHPANDGAPGGNDETGNAESATINESTSSVACQPASKITNHKPPPINVRNPGSNPDNSDLMSRLQTFLPQLRSANQELLSPSDGMGLVPDNNNSRQLDENLTMDEDSDGDDEGIDENPSKKRPYIKEVESGDRYQDEIKPSGSALEEKSNDAPTIQLEFTLGNISNNPLLKLLANDSEEDEDSLGAAAEDPTVTAGSQAIANMLEEPDNNLSLLESITNRNTSAESAKTTAKKRLITELS